MHRSILAIAAATALIISGPAYAQHGHGGGKPATSPSTQHGNSGATTHGQSGATTHGNSGATTHGSSGATTHGNSGATTHGNSGSHKPTSTGTMTHGKSGETHGGGNTKHSDTASATTTKKSSTTPTTTTSDNSTATGTTSTTTLTPVQQKLQKNTKLADKLSTRLPEGTDLMDAAKGFKNLGQFVAAVNVSNNLKLDFVDLKARMVEDGMSLGQAIQDVKKTANVDAEVTKAETEADSMIKSTTSTTTTSPTPTTSTNTTSTSTTSTKKTKKPSGDQ